MGWKELKDIFGEETYKGKVYSFSEEGMKEYYDRMHEYDRRISALEQRIRELEKEKNNRDLK